MNTNKPTTTNPLETPFDDPSHKEDWEDWEDEDIEEVKASDLSTDQHGLLIDISGEVFGTASKPAQPTHRNTPHRYSVHKPVRLKSKGRQKAQNAKVGIKVVTDMTKFQQQAQLPQQPQDRPAGNGTHDTNRGKFVDAAALLALEGEPTSASVGSFSWLKRRPGNTGNIKSKKSAKKTTQDRSSDLSPESRPIVIGISVPSDDASSHQVSPHTAVIETPLDMQNFSRKENPTTTNNATTLTPQQLRSVWSPDTEDSESPYSAVRPTSSIYSRPTTYRGSVNPPTDVPPVPALPATLKFKQTTGLAEVDDDDDGGTPCTLFEEDGSPTAHRKSQKPKSTTISPGSASSRAHGWWDHVTTPFVQQTNNPFKQQAQAIGSSPMRSPNEWWNGADEKKAPPSRASGLTIITPAVAAQPVASSSVASSSQSAPQTRPETHSEKARILVEENQATAELPPPYSPPQTAKQVKYTAILPPSQNAYLQPVPSPGPMTPGLPGTMTSQGAIGLSEIPLTPNQHTGPAAALHDRPAGTYVTGDHFYGAPGRFNKVERQRRRHEKEEVVARKVGGFWRGRGCVPADGCFGRTGREGRKRRRMCLGILGGVIAAIILIVVLVVVLTRRTSSKQEPQTSIWLNLTDFPPMPTGVLTVAGTENSVHVSDCFNDQTPSTAWSCSVPKADRDSVAPYAPNQPEFIFQIQYDNNSRALWKIADDEKGTGAELQDFLTDTGFEPQPGPPSIADMRFLGNTTDHIEAAEKAGESTPFFISLLETVNDTVGANMLTRRQGNSISPAPGNGTGGFNLSDILPAPELNGDGTGAPARLFPLATQQPIRLFDRGLPTEHYGFYTYFNKNIYLKNSTALDKADEDGGSLITDATSIVTFAQARFLVKIWTRKENTTQLLGNGTVPGEDGSSLFSTPGTMPYPVTIGEDMHGGNANKKTDYIYTVLDNQAIDTSDPKIVSSNRGFGGTLINAKSQDTDVSLGGIDGGTGGCKCEWINFQGLIKAS
ncbi:hypothetical protein F5X96DRAFT_21173 [Biscogniauxia mediterranea]|nr:hypothetical protein F5X96DRAFT_21173 [Biscogniauxia mediterranea]